MISEIEKLNLIIQEAKAINRQLPQIKEVAEKIEKINFDFNHFTDKIDVSKLEKQLTDKIDKLDLNKLNDSISKIQEDMQYSQEKIKQLRKNVSSQVYEAEHIMRNFYGYISKLKNRSQNFRFINFLIYALSYLLGIFTVIAYLIYNHIIVAINDIPEKLQKIQSISISIDATTLIFQIILPVIFIAGILYLIYDAIACRYQQKSDD